jgi:hypothetical protein
MSKSKVLPEDWSQEVEQVPAVTVKSNVAKSEIDSILNDAYNEITSSAAWKYLIVLLAGFLIGFLLINAVLGLFKIAFGIFLGMVVVSWLFFYADWRNEYFVEDDMYRYRSEESIKIANNFNDLRNPLYSVYNPIITND